MKDFHTHTHSQLHDTHIDNTHIYTYICVCLYMKAQMELFRKFGGKEKNINSASQS